MRRSIWIFFLIAFCCLFFWRDLLSIGLQGAVQWQLKCQIVFRHLSFQEGQIILDDVLVLSCSKKSASYHIHAKKIRLSMNLFQKPFRLHIAFDEPHLVILKGAATNAHRFIESRSKWLWLSISAENGAFEWQDAPGGPFMGQFCLKNKKLRLEADGGSLEAKLVRKGRERTIDCSFVHMPIGWLSHRLVPCICSGRINGSLSLHLDHQKIRRASGQLNWEDAAFSLQKWQIAGGAESIEWQGELTLANKLSHNWLDEIFSFPDRMKIKIHRAFISCRQSSFENLEGMFTNNRGVGLMWDVSGPSFSWEGKGFSKSCSANWLESTLCMHESRLFLRAQQLDAAHNQSVLELQQAGPFMVGLLHDFWPAAWPCQFDAGIISGRLIWEERGGSLENWKLEQLEGSDLAIHGDDWSLGCHRFEASMNQSNDAFLSLIDANARWKNIIFSSMRAHCQINDQTISDGSFRGSINGLEAQGSLAGSIKDVIVRASHLEEGESIESEADFIWNGNQFDLSCAHLEASHLDMSCLQSLFSIDCQGVADLRLNYANGELKLEGAGSKLKFNGRGGVFTIDQLGSTEPFDAGVRAVWEKASQRWTAQTAKTRCECCVHGRKITIDGQLEITNDLCKICVGKGDFEGAEFAGDWIFALENNIPFSFAAERLEGEIEPHFSCAKGHIICENNDFKMSGELLSDPALWQWSIKARLSEIQLGLLHDASANIIADSKEGLIECFDLKASLAIGNGRFNLCGAELRKYDQEWHFDFRVENGIWDWARLVGSAKADENHLLVSIDSAKSHLLNAPIHVQESRFGLNGSIESMKASCRLQWDQLQAASCILEKIDHSFNSLLRAPIQGAGLFEIDWGGASSLIQLQGDDLRYNGDPIPLMIRVYQKNDEWKIDRFLIHTIDLSASLKREENGWKIENGLFQWKDHLEASIGGYLKSFSKYELMIHQLKVNLQNLPSSFLGFSLEGNLEGNGSLTMQWDGCWKSAADFDFQAFNIKSGSFLIENARPIQLHFSNEQGLFIHGLDFQVRKPDPDWPCIHSCIGLMQFDIQRNHWLFHHSQVKLPSDSIGALRQNLGEGHPLRFFSQAIDNQHDLEFIADVDCASDFSSFTCSMREGFIPFLGAVRHLQKFNLNWNPSEMRATMSVIQGGHSLKIGAWMEFEPTFWGRLFLEDEEHQPLDAEMPLTIEWGVEAGKGVMIRSIEGTFGGIEASFHAEKPHSLIGSTRLHFGPLSEILPPRLGKVFHQLKMGKGFELKGRLFYDSENLSNISFKGLISGKQCELFGFQIRNLLTQIEIHPSHIHFFELKASDSAGIFTIDELQIQHRPDSDWTISMPLFKLMEFRPSLLQKAGEEPGHVGPLVVRELKLMDLKGNLEDSSTFTAKGEVSFVNSFKREHTVFDLPSDFLGRIIGLDKELLVPVTGKFKFELKEGRFWLFDLEDAYSEGRRSKFFLVKEGLSPTVDLDGNLHIFVTMKQYVLFKITENFLLTIDGPIESPFFHLQKKSKLLGLCGY